MARTKVRRQANLPCECGSGKPYKRCHREQHKAMQGLFNKIQARELPFTALTISEDGEPSSMQIGKVVVSQGGVERVLSEETLTLANNSVPGDKPQKSIAHVSLPINGALGSISTVGNATVGNGASPLSLQLNGGAKKLKASSPSGGFAVAIIELQRSTQLKCFGFLFGYEGQAEIIDDTHRKNRSHVMLLPDGNGTFLRLEGDGCEIATEREYSTVTKSILLYKVKIRSPQFLETLVAEFNASDTTVELKSIAFE